MVFDRYHQTFGISYAGSDLLSPTILRGPVQRFKPEFSGLRIVCVWSDFRTELMRFSLYFCGRVDLETRDLELFIFFDEMLIKFVEDLVIGKSLKI